MLLYAILNKKITEIPMPSSAQTTPPSSLGDQSKLLSQGSSTQSKSSAQGSQLTRSKPSSQGPQGSSSAQSKPSSQGPSAQ